MISARSSPRAAKPAPRLLRMSRNRSGYGSSMMLLTRSRSTALPLFSSGSRYWPSPGSPSGICSSGGGAGVPGARGSVGLALDELLADQRLRADQARRVVAEVLEARGRRSASRPRPCPARARRPRATGSSTPLTSTSATVADLGPGDPDLLARRPGRRRCRRSRAPRRCRRRRRSPSRWPGSPTEATSATQMTRIRLMVPGAPGRGRNRRRASRRPGTGGRSGSASRGWPASRRPDSG